MENEIKIQLTLENYDEVMKKLEELKKLLDEIANTNIQIEAK